MLKKILKAIRRRLLKIKWFKREVDRWKFEQQKRENRERFAHLMHVGKTVHTEDKPILIDYVDTRMLGQRYVTPQFIPKWWQLGVIDDSKDCDPGDCNDFGNDTREGAGVDSAGVGPCSGD